MLRVLLLGMLAASALGLLAESSTSVAQQKEKAKKLRRFVVMAGGVFRWRPRSADRVAARNGAGLRPCHISRRDEDCPER